MKSFGITDCGKVRKSNQDSFLIEEFPEVKGVLAVLCDGMGGEEGGNIASELASKTFISFIRDRISGSKLKYVDVKNLLGRACEAANSMVYSYSCFDKKYHGMGTTLVAAFVYNRKAYIINVGDSRAYAIKKDKIEQITRDHSYVQELLDSGKITALEARFHSKKNEITRALGYAGCIEYDIFTPAFRSFDKLLLCSDGLNNMISDEEIFESFEINPEPETFAEDLLNRAMYKGAKDNITIVVISK